MLIEMLAVLALSGGQAAGDQETRRAAPPQAEEARDRQVCRRERMVGSNRPQRVCMSAREWERIREESRDFHRNATREHPPHEPIQQPNN